MTIMHGLKWGAVLGAVLVLGTQILTWFELGTSNWYIIMTYLLVVIVSYFNVKNLKQYLGDAFGFIRSILAIAVMIIVSRYIFQSYMYVYIHFIDPTWIDTVAETWTAMLKEKSMSEEQIDSQIATFRTSYETLNMFTTEILFIGASQFVLGSIVSGLYNWRTK